MDFDDDNDEVIRELDVYITDMTQLLLLQFPLRPAYAEIPNINAAKFKPKNKKLELSVPYDRAIFGNDVRPPLNASQKFVSTSLHQTPFLSVGVVRDGALHITPVEDVLQIRPCFDNLVGRGEITEDMEDDVEDLQNEDPKMTLQQVHIRRKETEKTENSRLNSYTFVRSREDAEPWIDMTVFPADSDPSCENFDKMYYQPHLIPDEIESS